MEDKLLEVRRECVNEACGWIGLEHDTVHPKHSPECKLCPECYDVTEVVIDDRKVI